MRRLWRELIQRPRISKAASDEKDPPVAELRAARVEGAKRMSRASGADVAHGYAVRLLQHLVVPIFVTDPDRAWWFGTALASG
jgi:hypothetical protein